MVPGLPQAVDDLVARATRRAPGARPTDAGAMLAEVTTVREDLGQASSRHRSASDPTVVVPRIAAARPAWARLPEPPRPTPGPHPTPRRRRSAEPSGPAVRSVGPVGRITGTRGGRVGLAVAAIVLGLLAAVGGYWFGVGRYTEAPDLRTQARAQAEQLARTGGFTLRYDEGRYDEHVAKDTVLSQRPEPGQRILSGGTITLTLSLGPERYPMPDVIGHQYDLIVDDLQKLRMLAERTDVYDDNAPAGTVVATEPVAGTVIAPGATIKVKVSKGRAPATVPNVVGKNVNEARQIMAGAGLSLAVKQVDSTKPKDQVLEQDPADGVGVEKGATVTVSVSNGPPQVPVPDVVNRTLEEATAILTQAGFQVAPAGTGTVRAMNPPAGTPLPPGSTITIVAAP
jgi:serine/threonine-protein kinase